MLISCLLKADTPWECSPAAWCVLCLFVLLVLGVINLLIIEFKHILNVSLLLECLLMVTGMLLVSDSCATHYVRHVYHRQQFSSC